MDSCVGCGATGGRVGGRREWVRRRGGSGGLFRGRVGQKTFVVIGGAVTHDEVRNGAVSGAMSALMTRTVEIKRRSSS